MTDQVIIGPLTFDANGAAGLIYVKLQGWVSGAPVRAVVKDRPLGEGAFDVDRDFHGPRVLTFEGGVVGSGSQNAETNFFDRVAALQGNGAPILLQVVKDWGTRWAYVSIQDVAEVDPVGIGDMVAAVNIQMVARDPIKYGTSTTPSTGLPVGGGGLEYNLGSPSGALYYGANGGLGRVTLTNAGTADTYPFFTITGQLDGGFYLQCLETGQRLRYDHVVPAGSTVTIDSRTGQVLIDSISEASRYLTVWEFFPVPHGSSITVQFNKITTSSGSPTLMVSTKDGYW